jgi:hypothetical protein
MTLPRTHVAVGEGVLAHGGIDPNIFRGHSDAHNKMRLGMWVRHMEDWMALHPTASDDQITAAGARAVRFIAQGNSLFRLFKGARQLGELMRRTDLESSL